MDQKLAYFNKNKKQKQTYNIKEPALLTARVPNSSVQQQNRDISAYGSENYQGEEYDFPNSNRVTHKQELILLQSPGVLGSHNNQYNIKGQISPNRFNGGQNISVKKRDSIASYNKNSVQIINQNDEKKLKQALQPPHTSQSVFGTYKNSMQNLQTSSKILKQDLYMANASKNYKKYRNIQSNQQSQQQSQESNCSAKKQISSTYGIGIGGTGLTQSIRDKNFESQSIDIDQAPGSSTKTYVAPKRLNTLKLSTLSTPDPEKRKQTNINAPINEKKLLYNPQNQFQSKKMSIQNQQHRKQQIGQTVDEMDTNFDPIDQYGSQVRNTFHNPNQDIEILNNDVQKQKEVRDFNLSNTLKGGPKNLEFQNPKSLPFNLLHYQNNTPIMQKKLINDKHFQSLQQKKVEKESLKDLQISKEIGLQQPIIRPGSSLGGGIQLNKLSKLQRKEQDDIDDIDDAPEEESLSEKEEINNNLHNIEKTDDQKIFNSNQIQHQFQSLRDNQNQLMSQINTNIIQNPINNSSIIKKEIPNESDQKVELKFEEDPNKELKEEFLKLQQQLQILKKNNKNKDINQGPEELSRQQQTYESVQIRQQKYSQYNTLQSDRHNIETQNLNQIHLINQEDFKRSQSPEIRKSIQRLEQKYGQKSQTRQFDHQSNEIAIHYKYLKNQKTNISNQSSSESPELYQQTNQKKIQHNIKDKNRNKKNEPIKNGNNKQQFVQHQLPKHVKSYENMRIIQGFTSQKKVDKNYKDVEVIEIDNQPVKRGLKNQKNMRNFVNTSLKQVSQDFIGSFQNKIKIQNKIKNPKSNYQLAPKSNRKFNTDSEDENEQNNMSSNNSQSENNEEVIYSASISNSSNGDITQKNNKDKIKQKQNQEKMQIKNRNQQLKMRNLQNNRNSVDKSNILSSDEKQYNTVKNKIKKGQDLNHNTEGRQYKRNHVQTGIQEQKYSEEQQNNDKSSGIFNIGGFSGSPDIASYALYPPVQQSRLEQNNQQNKKNNLQRDKIIKEKKRLNKNKISRSRHRQQNSDKKSQSSQNDSNNNKSGNQSVLRMKYNNNNFSGIQASQREQLSNILNYDGRSQLHNSQLLFNNDINGVQQNHQQIQQQILMQYQFQINQLQQQLQNLQQQHQPQIPTNPQNLNLSQILVMSHRGGVPMQIAQPLHINQFGQQIVGMQMQNQFGIPIQQQQNIQNNLNQPQQMNQFDLHIQQLQQQIRDQQIQLQVQQQQQQIIQQTSLNEIQNQSLQGNISAQQQQNSMINNQNIQQVFGQQSSSPETLKLQYQIKNRQERISNIPQNYQNQLQSFVDETITQNQSNFINHIKELNLKSEENKIRNTSKHRNSPERQISGIYNDETPIEITNNISDLDITANEQQQFFINERVSKSYKFNPQGSFAHGPNENDNTKSQKQYENQKQNQKKNNHGNLASNMNKILDQELKNLNHEENKNTQRQGLIDIISDYDSPDFLYRKIDKKINNQDQRDFQNSQDLNQISQQAENQKNNKYKKDEEINQFFKENLIQNEKSSINQQQQIQQSNQNQEELDSPVRQKKPYFQLNDLKKQENLLVIGFDEQPKGKNPLLQNKRSPVYDKNSSFPTSFNFPQSANNIKAQQIGFQKQKQLSVMKKVDSIQQEQQKNNSMLYQKTLNQTIEQNNGKAQYNIEKDQFKKQKYTDSQEEQTQEIIKQESINQDINRKYQKAELIITDEMPNLQDFAKQKLTKEQFKNRFTKGRNQMCGSPQVQVNINNDIIQSSQTLNNNDIKQMQRQNQEFNLPINHGFHGAYRHEQSQEQPKRSDLKTKEELAQIRNKMMKSKFKDRKQQSQQELQKQEEIIKIGIKQFNINDNQLINLQHKSYIDIGKQIETEPSIGQNQEILLARLATGSKVVVDKKEMKKLTVKNYEKLPEVMKKKEEQKKQEEQAKRKAKYVVYQKELAQRIRNNNKKFQKKDNIEEEN